MVQENKQKKSLQDFDLLETRVSVFVSPTTEQTKNVLTEYPLVSPSK